MRAKTNLNTKQSRRAILSIDTADSKEVKVALKINRKKKEITKRTDIRTSQTLLPMINEILSKDSISFSELTEVQVNTGPGSFTGLRVGAAVANALGWLLGIPVNGKKNKLAEPIYK